MITTKAPHQQNYEMMRILTLGGCGYIGSALQEQFVADSVDLEYRGNPAGIRNDREDFANITEKTLDKYDAIILVAAHSSVKHCNDDPKGAYKNNVENFISLTKKLKKQKFIYASSSCVYGDQQNATEDDPVKPTDVLSNTKAQIDAYIKTTDIEYYGLRFGSVNGWSPNIRRDLVINSMTLSARRNGYLVVKNETCSRPILGICDLCRAIQSILVSDDKRGIYNVASFNSTFGQLGQDIAELTGAYIIHETGEKTYDFSMDCGKFEKAFNFTFKESVGSIVASINLSSVWRS